MRSRSAFRHALSLVTWLAVIVPLCSTAPVIPTAGDALDDKSWHKVSKGTWLVEHFSPYCVHCKMFAPTWKQLVEDRQAEALKQGFHFAQVDCAANGDLCHKNKVKYYPSLFLYVDGEMYDEYDGKRTIEELSKYVDANMPGKVVWLDKDGKPEQHGENVKPAVKDDDARGAVKADVRKPDSAIADQGDELDLELDDDGEDDSGEHVEPEPTLQADQDDDYEDVLNQVEKGQADSTESEHRLAAVVDETGTKDSAVKTTKDLPVNDPQPAAPGFVQQVRKNAESKKSELPRPDGQVHVLKAEGVAALKEDDAKPAFVKYYAPWCSHCKSLAPKWTDMAASLAGSVHVYEMDCDNADNKRACREENVRAFPTLIFYSKGGSIEYHGKRDAASMKEFALKTLSATTIKPIANEYELNRAASDEPVIILFLHSSETDKEDIDLATSSAKSLMGGAPFYTSTSLDLYQLFDLPATSPYLLVFKDGSLVPTDVRPLPRAPANPSGSASSTRQAAKSRLEATTQWLRSAKLPTLTELSGSTFRDLMPTEGEPPLVALAVLSHRGLKGGKFEDMKQTMLGMAQAWKDRRGAKSRGVGPGQAQGRDVVWSWVDGDKWAGWIHKMYEVKQGGWKAPALVIADPKALTYWKTTTSGQPLPFDSAEVFDLIENGIYTGKAKAKSSRNFVDKLSKSVVELPSNSLSAAANHPFLTLAALFASWVTCWYCLKACCGPSTSSRTDKSPAGSVSGKSGTSKYD